MSRPLELRRAKKAFACVQQMKGISDIEKKYASYVKSAPTMVLSNGLGQSLAFWYAKSAGDKPEAKAYKKMCEHINDNVRLNFFTEGKKNILQRVVEDFNAIEYRRTTTEVMEFLKWLKKFASSELKQEENER